MDPNAQPPTQTQVSPPEGSKSNALLALISVFILLGVVGITLFLYLQNKSNRPLLSSDNKNDEDNKNQQTTIAAGPTLSVEQKKEKYGVVCIRYTNLKEALGSPDTACVLDLSGQNLTEVPDEISKLTGLQTLNLSKNKLTSFPNSIVNMPHLTFVDLSNNQITKASGIKKPKVIQNKDLTVSTHSFQSIDLRYNGIDVSEQTKFKSSISSKEIIF